MSRTYKCRMCGKNLGEMPLVELCNECNERYRKDEAFREEYHRRYGWSGEE